MVSPVERVSVAAIAVAAGFAVASAALAQGGPQKTYNWSGLYAGVGGGMAGISFDEAITPRGGSANFTSPVAGSGAFGTVIVGYDVQATPGLVLGAFADYDFGNVEVGHNICPGCIPSSPAAGFRRDGSWSLGARIGVLTSQSTLVYVPFGITQSSYSGDGRYTTLTPRDTTKFKDSSGGKFVGLGIETMLGGNWSLRGEYRYAMMSDSICLRHQGFGQVGSCGLTSFSSAEGLVEQSARFALGYRFGAERSGQQGDSIKDSPPVERAAAYNWTGIYIGAGLGYGAMEYIQQSYDLRTSAEVLGDNRGGRGGFATGIVGFDWQFARSFVVGAFADIDRSRIIADTFCGSGTCVGRFNDAFKREGGWSVGGRIGWLPTQGTMIYVPVGYTNSDYKWGGGFTLSNLSGEHSGSSGGYFAGLGIETLLSQNWSLRAEYRYAEMDAKLCVSSSRFQTAGLCRNVDNSGIQNRLIRVEDIVEQSARLTLSYKVK